MVSCRMRSRMLRWMSASVVLGLSSWYRCGLPGQEGGQGVVAFQRVADLVVGQRQLPHFLAGVMPGGHIAGGGRALVHGGLGLEVKGRVEVGDPVQQDGRLVGVGLVAGHQVRRRQAA